MKIQMLLFVAFVFGTNLLWGQKAEKVLRITASQRTGDYYAEQTRAWEKVLEQDKVNADAWLNYFTAARYSNIFNSGPKVDLDKIVAGAAQAVPKSFEAAYLKFWLKPWDEGAFEHLQEAYKIDPNRTETYHEFATHYLRKGNMGLFKEFCKKQYLSPANSPGLLAWNHNALVNLDQQAILLTEGDNDTYPAWTLQEVKRFREDVLVVNTNLLMSEDYRSLIFSRLKLPTFTADQSTMERGAFRLAMIEHILNNTKRPLYFGIGLHQDIRDAFEANLFLVGLSFKYSKKAVDEVAILKKAYENDFHWDQIKMSLGNDPNQAELDRYSRSYLPCLMKVYHAYRKEKVEEKAEDLKKLILIIGEKSNSLEETKTILAKY